MNNSMSSTKTRSIIVVDDEVELANLFKIFLENQGYNAISFVDPLLHWNTLSKLLINTL